VNALPLLFAVPPLEGDWENELRRLRFIAHGTPTKHGGFPKDGLHERNAWLYEALVCMTYFDYSQKLPQPAAATADGFLEFAFLIRRQITDGNKSFGRYVENWISQLTYLHLHDVGLSGLGQDVYNGKNRDQEELLVVFAHYVSGHALTNGGASACRQNPVKTDACATLVETVKRTGSGSVIVPGTTQWQQRWLVLADGTKIAPQ
jgi:hypothetical protein